MTDTRPPGQARSLQGSALRPFSVLAIALAAISPTTSVFLVYGTGLASAGPSPASASLTPR